MDPLTVVLFVAGLVLLVVGAEALVRGASRIATTLGISPLVVGLTIVAFGTSAPEFAVSVSSALDGSADVAIGNVVGSNIFNVLFILGVSAVVAPLVVTSQLIRLDVPLMIAASAALLLVSIGGVVSRLEGALLFAGIVAYTGWAIVSSRREGKAIAAEYGEAFGAERRSASQLAYDAVRVAAGLGLLILGSRWFVDGATEAAEALGVSELVIGLTVVAAGTSMPELATSVVASIRGERDIAVGNVVGSNIFNILAVVGASSLVVEGGIPVSATAINVDIIVMIGVAVICLPVFMTGSIITRLNGVLFIALYAAYVLYLYVDATASEGAGERAADAIRATFAVLAIALALWAYVDIRRRPAGTGQG
ncbi:MAG: sodium:calcium antiporter [Chloroflexota bacterium]